MVLKSNGNSELDAHVHGWLFDLFKASFFLSRAAINLIFFFFKTDQCATCSELPYSISTMLKTYLASIETNNRNKR